MIVAFIIPFEMFLFSYAILGPLHYLTEISWLHKRNYFAKGKYDFIWLVVLALFGTFAYLGIAEFKKIGMIAPFIALVSGITFYFIKDWYLKLLAIIMGFMAASLLKDSTFFLVFFLVFLPTIFHVFLFSGTFMLHGAVKSKSVTGKISVLVLILCAMSFFYFDPVNIHYTVGEGIKKSYHDFAVLNMFLINFFQFDNLKKLDTYTMDAIFGSAGGIKIMRFIAFAYTYHYLNWFSKTSIIKWHLVDKKYLIATLAIWLSAVGIYAYDYKTGLKFLFLLSIMHVFLEFPLNFKTFSDLGEELKFSIFGKKKAA